MTGIEQRMTALENSARVALQEADTLGAGLAAAKAELGVAQTELARFLAVHRQILALSRRNSNVRSLELALGQHRLLALECQDSLRALAEELQKRGFRATRLKRSSHRVLHDAGAMHRAHGCDHQTCRG